MEKTYRIKTNNQELLIRKQNESDATSRWIDFQKTSLRREKDEYELTLEIFNLSTISFFTDLFFLVADGWEINDWLSVYWRLQSAQQQLVNS